MNALSALYDETSVSVFSLILRIVQDRQSAEDILRRGGLSARQAGVRLGLSPQYVTQQICLALKKLRMTIDGRKERPRWPFVERVGNILFFPKPYSKV